MEMPVSGLPGISGTKLQQLQQYAELLLDINSRINLISRKETDHIFDRHIVHSLSIAHYFNFSANSRIVDVGSGGGFPAIPLAIYFDNVEFTLVESIRKKAGVLTDIAVQTGLKNVRVLNQRSEQVTEKFDFVTGRAVTAFPDFYRITAHLISSRQQNAMPNGIIYLKGGDFSDELKGFPMAEIYDIQALVADEYFSTKHIIYLPVKAKNK
ncbi:MAG: 16S rRNA (guanine(527)-N(7))-methyltransferase RsmG [Bacteroidales bacterium]|nr:16S rRNA (guanine(527)-N(7))-methyltransferase RsmG [Bacteroidales bacterium]